MESLSRFDVAQYNGTLFVIVESELLPPDYAVVGIPLLTNYPAIRLLNPTIKYDGRDYVLATRLIASVRRKALSRVGSVYTQGDEITRAIDILMSGV
ncbi:MAG: CcdB family protein [Mangrovicoccus sp.]